MSGDAFDPQGLARELREHLARVVTLGEAHADGESSHFIATVIEALEVDLYATVIRLESLT